MARKAKLGSGGRARKLIGALSKRKGIKNPRALAAYLGRKKYGKARFQKLASAGRRRAAARRHK